MESNSIKTIPLDYYFPLTFESRAILNLVVTISHVEIVKGVIFPSVETVEFISKIDLQTI